jgi:plastocyanin
MKTLGLLLSGLAIISFSLSTMAATHTVSVQDFQFSPAVMSVNVGDTISWVWINGNHTTTSISVPDGASGWNSEINSSTPVFSYVVMVAGSYSYNCTIHPTTMVGTFTAVSSTGISSVTSNPFVEVSNSLVSDELEVTYSLSTSAKVDIALFDLAGSRVKNFISAFHTPGEYSEVFALGNLPKGMYFLSFITKDEVVTRKLVVE